MKSLGTVSCSHLCQKEQGNRVAPILIIPSGRLDKFKLVHHRSALGFGGAWRLVTISGSRKQMDRIRAALTCSG